MSNPNQQQTRGEQIVQEWLLNRSRFISDVDQADLASRIDQELAKAGNWDWPTAWAFVLAVVAFAAIGFLVGYLGGGIDMARSIGVYP